MEFWFQQTQKGDDQGKGKHIKNGTQPAGRNDGMSLNASKQQERQTICQLEKMTSQKTRMRTEKGNSLK